MAEQDFEPIMAEEHAFETGSITLEDRLAYLDELDEDFENGGKDPIRILSEEANGRRVIDSVEEFLPTLTIRQLTSLLEHMGEEKIPKGPKRVLVEKAYELFPRDVQDLMEPVLALGTDWLAQARAVLDAGGRIEYATDDIHSLSDVSQALFPVTLLFEQKDAFVKVMPREVRETLGALDDAGWAELERQARVCDGFLNMAGIICDLRGMVSVQEICDTCLDEDERSLGQNLRDLLVSDGPWLDKEGIVPIADERHDYFLSSSLMRQVVRKDSEALDAKTLDGLLADHRRLLAKVPDEADLDFWGNKGTVLRRLLRTEEAQALIALLDEHVPEGNLDITFAPEVCLALCWRLRGGEDISALDDILHGHHVRPVGRLAHELACRADALDRVVPKWHLNGWSRAEVEERLSEEGFLSADTKPADLLPERPVPDEPEDGGLSGYVDLYEEGRARELSGSTTYTDVDHEEVDIEGLVSENYTYLEEFEDWLDAAALSDKTVTRHVDNAYLFLSRYLAEHEGVSMADGYDYVGDFLGGFFIRSYLWATPASIRTFATSLKKLYRCMYEHERVERWMYESVRDTIESDIDKWCDTCKEYNDPIRQNPFALW